MCAILNRPPRAQPLLAAAIICSHPHGVRTFAYLARELNRSPVFLSGLQKRFELPPFEGAAYSDAYLAFLRTVIDLRTLDIPADTLRDLWQLEKKLLQLLHVDTTGSRTWFLDACGQTSHPECRLLLTNHDLGIALDAQELQPGLNFAATPPELFPGAAMGEDALRVLRECLKIRDHIRSAITAELPHVREAAHWATTFIKPHKRT